MRPELTRTADVNSLSLSDIERTLELAERFAASHAEKVERGLAPLRNGPTQAAIEIISDEAHYANVGSGYIRTFAPWRLQAVVEGIIAQSFLLLTERPLVGVRRKLNAMKTPGFVLDRVDEDALCQWADLRNRWGHEPPYPYHGVWLEHADVEEYARLVSPLVLQWGIGKNLPLYHRRLSSQ